MKMRIIFHNSIGQMKINLGVNVSLRKNNLTVVHGLQALEIIEGLPIYREKADYRKLFVKKAELLTQ